MNTETPHSNDQEIEDIHGEALGINHESLDKLQSLIKAAEHFAHGKRCLTEAGYILKLTPFIYGN